MRYFRICTVTRRLEGGGNREEEAAARRIRRNVLEAAERLRSEVRHFGIHAGVVRPGHQIPPAQLEANRLCAPAEDRAGEAVGKLVRERDFAELHEARV